ncbi:DUF1642 domain-containing protein [Streptococcus suis]
MTSKINVTENIAILIEKRAITVNTALNFDMSINFDNKEKEPTLDENGPDAVEVEKEQLYIVEIPDPNSYSDYRYLSRNDNGICLDASNDNKWKQKKRNQFTESEIKHDFEWAWDAGFAKPVEVEND